MDNNSIFILIGLLIISLSFCNSNTNSQNNIFSSIYLILIVGIIFNLMKSESFVKNSGTINSNMGDALDDASDEIEYFDNIEDNNINEENLTHHSDNESNVHRDIQENVGVPKQPPLINHSAIVPSTCNTISSAELLPTQNDEFATENINFINDSEFRIGLQSQTLRNANLNLRGEPPNPQVKVSPWLQSTIEPDLNRRSLDSCS